VALLVEAVRYKSENRVFGSRWCPSEAFFLGVDSTSNRNKYQEYFLGGGGGGEEIANPKAPKDYSSTPVFAPDKHFATPYYGCRIDESSLFILKLFTLRVLYK